MVLKNGEDVIRGDQRNTEDNNFGPENSNATNSNPLFASWTAEPPKSNRKLKNILIFVGCALGLGSALFLALIGVDMHFSGPPAISQSLLWDFTTAQLVSDAKIPARVRREIGAEIYRLTRSPETPEIT